MAKRKTKVVENKDEGCVKSNSEKFDEAIKASEDGRVAIFMHKNPDPDSMGSAVGLQWILSKKYGRESTIFVDGVVSHKQNETMVNVLEIHMLRIDDYKEDEFSTVIVVDATTKNSFVNKADIVIDHHRSEAKQAKFACVEAVGASATLVWEIIKGFGLEFEDDSDSKIATALFFGIRMDTEELISETTTDRDYKASQALTEYIDRKKLAAVIKFPLPPYLFELKKLLDMEGNCIINGAYFIGTVGIISAAKRDALPMIADERVCMEGIETAVIFAIVNGGIDVSVRSGNTSLDVNAFCQKIFGKDYAGGKLGMGGAFVPMGILGYDTLPKELITELWSVQKKALFHKIMHIALGN